MSFNEYSGLVTCIFKNMGKSNSDILAYLEK